jgi:hypothetical protein
VRCRQLLLTERDVEVRVGLDADLKEVAGRGIVEVGSIAIGYAASDLSGLAPSAARLCRALASSNRIS